MRFLPAVVILAGVTAGEAGICLGFGKWLTTLVPHDSENGMALRGEDQLASPTKWWVRALGAALGGIIGLGLGTAGGWIMGVYATGEGLMAVGHALFGLLIGLVVGVVAGGSLAAHLSADEQD